MVDPRSGGVWGPQRYGAGPPQVESAPSGGSDPRSGGAWGPQPYAYFSRMRADRSTSRKVSASESPLDTASITEQAIIR